jgi:hypothetical protein
MNCFCKSTELARIDSPFCLHMLLAFHSFLTRIKSRAASELSRQASWLARVLLTHASLVPALPNIQLGLVKKHVSSSPKTWVLATWKLESSTGIPLDTSPCVSVLHVSLILAVVWLHPRKILQKGQGSLGACVTWVRLKCGLLVHYYLVLILMKSKLVLKSLKGIICPAFIKFRQNRSYNKKTLHCWIYMEAHKPLISIERVLLNASFHCS